VLNGLANVAEPCRFRDVTVQGKRKLKTMVDGYYWCIAPDKTLFVALNEKGTWWIPGVENPVFEEELNILCAVVPPELMAEPLVDRLQLN
jgi:hypothetical protein